MNRRSLFLVLALLFCLAACRESEQDSGPPDRAVALNDSAVTLAFSSMHQDTTDLMRAVALLDSAIAMDSTYRRAYWNKASLLCEHDRKEAIATTQEWLYRNPTDYDFRFVLARLLGDRKEMKAVARYKQTRLDSLMRAHPDSVGFEARRALWDYAAGNREEARVSIESLAASHPHSQTTQILREALSDSVGMDRFISVQR